MPPIQFPIAQQIAQALIEGFDKHYRLFRGSAARAKARFEAGDWAAVQVAARERIQFYDDRVNETVERLHNQLRAESLDLAIWQEAKLLYMGLLVNHKQPELAETFFNSVSCKILHRTYFNNDFIFFRPAISTEYIESDPPTYRSYYPSWEGMRDTFRQIEALGGMLPAIEQGFFQREISDAAYQYQREIDQQVRTIVGVNDYVDEKPITIPLLQMDPQGYERQVKRLQTLRQERDNGRVGQALDRLRLACQGTKNTMPHILDCVRAYATLSEIVGVQKEVFGKYEEPTWV